MHTELHHRWREAIWEAVGPTTASPGRPKTERVASEGRALLARWDEPHRRYHTRKHLTQFLTAVESLTAAPPVTVRLAGWFHDAVYQGHPGADEAASGVVAQEVLSYLDVPDETVIEVLRLIALTAGHRVAPNDAAGALMVDADLSILGTPAPEYAQYAAAVRQEYRALADDDFRRGRLQVLQDLLARPQLFHTRRGQELWQPQARINLAHECTLLQSALNLPAAPPPTG